MNVNVWLEVIPERSQSGYLLGVHVGRTWKRAPAPSKVAPGALAVKVALSVPTDRLTNVVEAVVTDADPVTLRRS